MQGRKNVEVKLIWANKADVLAQMLHDEPDFDLLMAAGDDKTDEDLFEKMGPETWTIHIGSEQTVARYRLRDYREMRELLAAMSGDGGMARTVNARDGLCSAASRPNGGCVSSKSAKGRRGDQTPDRRDRRACLPAR